MLVALPVAVVGGTVGSVLLLEGPPGSFEKVVPFLVALAAVLLLVSPRVRALGEGRRMSGDDGALGLGVTVLVFLCCVYGGYFGAAAGVMILAVLLSRTDRPLPVSNALKNVFLGAANASAAVVFAFRAPVEWAAVPALLVGCILGGWLRPGGDPAGAGAGHPVDRRGRRPAPRGAARMGRVHVSWARVASAIPGCWSMLLVPASGRGH